MKKPGQLSVKTDALITAADDIEAQAIKSLAQWAVTGRAHRYNEDMGLATTFRQAAKMKGVRERREFLRALGMPC